MRRNMVGVAASALSLAAAPIAAQSYEHRALELTPSAGYMFFGDYLEGPLGTNLANAAGPLYGVQLDLNLSRNIGFYGHAGYASSDLQVGIPIVGGVNLAATNVYLYDAGIELRAPTRTGGLPIVPFVQVGAGAVRHEIETPLFDIRATNTAFNAGLGLDVQITPSIGLRAMAKDYVGRFDFEEATMLEFDGRTAHNVGLSLGLKVGF